MEEKLEEYELLEALDFQNDDVVTDKTTKAISKINELLELNQEISLNNGEEVKILENTIKDKDATIENLKKQVKEKEEEIIRQKQLISSLEKDINKYREQIKVYAAYKTNYERIMNFLEENLK